jgi:hypothetical protein
MLSLRSKLSVVRVPARLLICLLAGAAMNVLIAWIVVPWPWRGYWLVNNVHTPVARLSTWPYPFPDAIDTPRDGTRCTTLAVDVDDTFTYWGRAANGYRFGLPFRSLAAWTYGWHGGGLHGSGYIAPEWRGALFVSCNDWRRTAFVSDSSGKRQLLLGWHPLWPGFALNTLFYAPIAWSLWQLPLAIRRRARRRAGKCTHCAYDLKGLTPDTPCPECGTIRLLPRKSER